MMAQKKGTLYLIPVTLGDNATIPQVLPLHVVQTVGNLTHFIVEKTRSARRFISATHHPLPIESLTFYELDKHSDSQNSNEFLKPLLQGISMGLMSEAGTPAVADPGSQIVARAHELKVEVVPLTGPNSLILALMASGFNGQGFTFHGYLPIDSTQRIRKIKEIEVDVYKKRQTQLFIETPYRNHPMFESIVTACRPQTKLCIACDLTLPTQWIKTLTVSQWKKETVSLHKRPTVFLLFQ